MYKPAHVLVLLQSGKPDTNRESNQASSVRKAHSA